MLRLRSARVLRLPFDKLRACFDCAQHERAQGPTQGKRAWLQYNNGVFAVDNYFSVGLELTPGLVYFITPKFGIEGTMGSLSYQYSGISLKGDSGGYNYSSFTLNLSNYYLGLNYYF